MTIRNLLILRIEYFLEFAKIAQYATKTLQKSSFGQPPMESFRHVQRDSH